MKFDISVFEGGEDLYVYPFSVNKKIHSSANKIVYLNPDEFYVYKNDFILEDNYSYVVQWLKMTKILSFKRLWYCKIKKFFVALARSIKLIKEYGIDRHSWKNFYFYMGWLYRNSTPFLAASYPDIRISLRGQLAIKDNDNISDTYYLNPSQEYLHKRVIDWIKKETQADGDDCQNFSKKDAIFLQKWMKEEKEKGREIVYLASLDT